MTVRLQYHIHISDYLLAPSTLKSPSGSESRIIKIYGVGGVLQVPQRGLYLHQPLFCISAGARAAIADIKQIATRASSSCIGLDQVASDRNALCKRTQGETHASIHRDAVGNGPSYLNVQMLPNCFE